MVNLFEVAIKFFSFGLGAGFALISVVIFVAGIELLKGNLLGSKD